MKHLFEELTSDIQGTYWWCSRCGVVEHNDSEEGQKYVPFHGSCENTQVEGVRENQDGFLMGFLGGIVALCAIQVLVLLMWMLTRGSC